MSLIWVISLDVFCQQMFMQDFQDFKATIPFTFVELINMELQLRLRLFNKEKLQKKFVITIMKSIRESMNGLILDSITLGELVQNGIQKFANKFSWI